MVTRGRGTKHVRKNGMGFGGLLWENWEISLQDGPP